MKEETFKRAQEIKTAIKALELILSWYQPGQKITISFEREIFAGTVPLYDQKLNAELVEGSKSLIEKRLTELKQELELL